MKIFLIRHGESEGNVINEINDNPNRIVNLTSRGRAQAEDACSKLSSVSFVGAYASEFPRAKQTAEILLRTHDLPLRVDARLNERRSGMDGMPVHTFNDLIRSDPLRIKPPLGESFLEQMERLRNFLDEIALLYPEDTVLAVSHENPIIAALALTVSDPELVIANNLGNCEWVEIAWPVD
jgi:broad specificity phosphatase PhoE